MVFRVQRTLSRIAPENRAFVIDIPNQASTVGGT